LGLNRRYDVWVTASAFSIKNPLEIEQPKKKKKSEGEKEMQKIRLEEELRMRNVDKICIREYVVDAWYFSPYPKEVIKNGTIHICEFCLYYFSSSEQLCEHAEKCDLRHPPGTKIYDDGELSFWELDGYLQRNYCRNISLISKLFLDHKSLYYDIDVFMFYVLCKRDAYGYQVVGYFSKEKISEQGYNLACILSLPYEQRKGYGKILMDFSYLLSRKDRKIAGPEKPLSDLGLLSYRAYWLEVILETLGQRGEMSIQQLSKETYIAEEDILGTLIANKMIKYCGDELGIVVDGVMEQRMKAGRRRKVDPKAMVPDYKLIY
ncbi:histone acetyltransferase HTATIP, partial [Enteropsectra breve]